MSIVLLKICRDEIIIWVTQEYERYLCSFYYYHVNNGSNIIFKVNYTVLNNKIGGWVHFFESVTNKQELEIYSILALLEVQR